MKHSKFFGSDITWDKHAAAKYPETLVNFMRRKDLKIKRAHHRGEPATFYLHRESLVCVIEDEGVYVFGWEFDQDQLDALKEIGNLN